MIWGNGQDLQKHEGMIDDLDEIISPEYHTIWYGLVGVVRAIYSVYNLDNLLR